MSTIKLSLNNKSESVELGEGESLRKLEIREMSAAKRDGYLDKLSKRVRIDSAGKPSGLKEFDGMQSDLLTRCLFDGEKLVPAEEIQSWPASTVNQLFKAAQKLNQLNEDEAAASAVEAERKNG